MRRASAARLTNRTIKCSGCRARVATRGCTACVPSPLARAFPYRLAPRLSTLVYHDPPQRLPRPSRARARPTDRRNALATRTSERPRVVSAGSARRLADSTHSTSERTRRSRPPRLASSCLPPARAPLTPLTLSLSVVASTTRNVHS